MAHLNQPWKMCYPHSSQPAPSPGRDMPRCMQYTPYVRKLRVVTFNYDARHCVALKIAGDQKLFDSVVWMCRQAQRVSCHNMSFWCKVHLPARQLFASVFGLSAISLQLPWSCPLTAGESAWIIFLWTGLKIDWLNVWIILSQYQTCAFSNCSMAWA